MKHLFVFLFLVFVPKIYAQDTLFKADQIGKPEYTQLVSSDRIYPVIKGIEESYIELLPTDYFHMNYRYDTIKIELIRADGKLKLNCLNCMYMQLGLTDSSVFYIESGADRVEFDWQLMAKPNGGSGPPLKEKQKLDETFGYVKLKNRLTRYVQIQKDPPLFLAFLDRNFNGRIDSTDYVSLSETTYFPTAINSRVNLVGRVDTISTDWWDATFQLVDDKGQFALHKIKDSVFSPALLFSKAIGNFQLDSLTDLSSFLKRSDKDYTIITFWNEYCPNCISELDSLEKLQERFQILTFYNRDDLQKQMEKGSWTFNTYLSSRFAEEAFRLNGMPNYWVLDKQRVCLLKTRNYSDLKVFLSQSESFR
ncbi:hypothetical protein [uncultured Fluviicola sp.]|jgi:thiol-disulfide isomerase/thioredoxin|uniref:TlpA family protein disulfide reductase n=1 Tax=uncultured Fluviicola sp. TaxID=463303 RepID=UPI0025D52AB1|nr:hypothetical protein [uncultured Fluviicola sp.]